MFEVAQALVAARASDGAVVGLLVLGFRQHAPKPLAAAVLHSIAVHLADAESEASAPE